MAAESTPLLARDPLAIQARLIGASVFEGASGSIVLRYVIDKRPVSVTFDSRAEADDAIRAMYAYAQREARHTLETTADFESRRQIGRIRSQGARTGAVIGILLMVAFWSLRLAFGFDEFDELTRQKSTVIVAIASGAIGGCALGLVVAESMKWLRRP